MPTVPIRLSAQSLCRHAALLLALLAGALPGAHAADSPASQLAGWTATARSGEPAFSASADRGKRFFTQRNTHNADMPSCSTCHTDNPAATGKHVITSKAIQPLSPNAHAERFSDATKSEKWFKRNCNDVLGRACSAGEKADLLSFLLTQR